MAIQQADAERLGSANREIQDHESAADLRRTAAARTRRQLHLMDDLIGTLEERNLRGERRVDRSVRKWVRRLQEEVAVPLPRRVLRARTTARLHGALLDWMEGVFCELVPEGRNRAMAVDPRVTPRHKDLLNGSP